MNEEFIKELWPYAVAEAERLGVDPRTIVAQAAIETGWGKSAPGNNMFGIKSHGKAGGNRLMTNEVVDGKTVRVKDSFRSYPDRASSVKGYGDFIASNPRYQAFRAADGLADETAALQASGYATDPNYGAKVYNIASGIDPAAMPGAGMPPPPDYATQFKNAQPAQPQQAIDTMTAQPGGQGQMPEVTVTPDQQSAAAQPMPQPRREEDRLAQVVGHPVYSGGGGMYYFDDPLSGRAMPVNSDPRIMALIAAIQGGGGNGAA